jgi:2-polyprenyl-3-methyl-5-hydroxy-6-metoxy-1,4-benzoquinol methylase
MGTPREDSIRDEFRQGKRFQFGKNWQSFLRTVDEHSITDAERRLIEFLDVSSLNRQFFLDVGCGSGLHSLAACRLGARVVSFDYDPDAVDATCQLRARFPYEEDTWRVEAGSVLDSDYLATLGEFDVVYSWGVLHHTGAMWQALENVKLLVKEGGTLYIAIYNDKGKVSRWWTTRKKRYCSLPSPLKPLYFLWVYTRVELREMGFSRKIHKVPRRFRKYIMARREYKKDRGMSRWHDMIDWIGGYPYEYAKAEDLVAFYEKAGFRLKKLARNDGTGNHELVFVKRAAH